MYSWDDMSTLNKKCGVVAILDALGAANYDDEEIKEFLKSRGVVMRLLHDKAESMTQTLDVSRVKTYTFNDTMLITLESQSNYASRPEIQAFVTILRKLLVDSLRRKIIFRGSFAVGEFYEDQVSNTILGKAVTDAAAWYDRADWIGVLATPRTTVHIDHLRENDPSKWDNLLVRYDVPLSEEGTGLLYAINWPKVFWVDSITPCRKNEKPKEALLRLLSQFVIPKGTESKHFNAIAFFDRVAKSLKVKDGRGARKAR